MRNEGFGNRGPRNFGGEEHDAVCTDCKQACKVPFVPAKDKPVYCRACLPNHPKPKKF